MKKRFAWFGAVAIALVSFCLAVFLGGNPSDAVSNKYKALISAGVIDAVVEPSELGLDYLREQPPELAANDSVMNAIRMVDERLSVMPEKMPMGIPVGENYPIRIGTLNDGGQTEASRYSPGIRSINSIPALAVAVVDKNGSPQNITPGNVASMPKQEALNGGNLPSSDEGTFGGISTPILFAQPENRILLADASRSFKMAKRVPVLNLIVARKQKSRDGRIITRNYLIENVNANAVCRDLLNATLNKKLQFYPNRSA